MGFLKVLKDGFNRYQGGFNPYDVSPNVSEDIQQTLSRLVGWDIAGEQWRDIIVDSDGRVLTSSGATVATIAAHSNPTVGLVSVALLPSNPDRNSFTIFNNSGNDIEIQYAATAVLGQGIVLKPSVLFIEDTWSGAVSAISSVAANNVRVLELE